MSYIEPSEWDETVEELEQEEESAGESVLRNEREAIISRMNQGIIYCNLNLEDLI